MCVRPPLVCAGALTIDYISSYLAACMFSSWLFDYQLFVLAQLLPITVCVGSLTIPSYLAACLSCHLGSLTISSFVSVLSQFFFFA